MKAKHIITIAALAATLQAGAQSLWDASKPDHNFTFGLRTGGNFASTDKDYATSTRMGFHGGATVDWNIVKSLSLSSGIYYTEKGFKSDYGKGRTGYLEAPLLLSYRLDTPTGVQFHLNVGGYAAWGISGKVKYAPYDMTFTYNYNQKSFGEKGFFRHFDAGLSAGAFIVVKHVLLGVTYEYGLMDIAKVYSKFHNRSVSMTVGYNF